MKKLPIGMSTLRNMLEEGYIYVDKTEYVKKLVQANKYYFLSRPRRFGKSLLLDTLKSLFSAHETLFQGLHIHPHWDWSVSYPVIHISFGSGVFKTRAELDQRIHELLLNNQEQLEVTCQQNSITGCFGELIRKAQTRFNQNVVILVDEYDKPILDNITEPETAKVMREGLKNLYSVIKDNDHLIRFVFITGVSKFSKVSIFSGLNNLIELFKAHRYHLPDLVIIQP